MTGLLDAIDQPHVQLLLRLLVGGLLLLAAATKLADRNAFRAAVADYEVLPAALERPFAALLPLVELTLGGLLLLGLATEAAAWLAVPVFLSFAIAIAANLLRGRDFNCHCFGAAQSDQIGWPALTRSLLLAGAALTVALGASRFGALDAAVFGDTAGLPPVSEAIPMILLALVLFNALMIVPEALATRTSFRRTYGARGGHSHGHDHAATPNAEAAHLEPVRR